MVLHRNRRDFAEFTLHHFATIILIVNSYSANYLAIGSVVMLVHDASDAFVNIFRIVVETCKMQWVVFTYSLLLMNWIYLRLYVFPVYVIYIIVYEYFNNEEIFTNPV